MWNVKVWHGPDLFLTHSQSGFAPVLQFAVNSIIEMNNKGALDYRVEMTNETGYLYFFAIGSATKNPINITKVKDVE